MVASIGLAGSAPSNAAISCGAVLVGAGDWLGGSGVDVRSNGVNQGTAVSCGGGTSWQCVELAARLYAARGWGTVRAGGNQGAKYIPEGSPGLTFHANGDGYVPVPGDLVIEDGTQYGHVAVVDFVSGSFVGVVEQNANANGRSGYQLSGSTLTGGHGHVRGTVHSPANSAGPPPGDGKRFVRPGSPAQYLSMRGGALPITYGDALKFDAEGNSGLIAYSGPLAQPVLPANTVLRPVGGPAQFFFDGSVRHPIQDPATSDCLVYAFPQPGVAVVPADWAAGLPVGSVATCSLPDGTRLTETGSLAQYLSVRGAALPVTYADAVRLEGEGNHTNAVMAAGYVSNSLHAPRLPANTVLRPVGGPAQFFFDGSVRHPIQDPATSDCLVYAFPQPGVAVVPADWAAGLPVGSVATCSLPDGTRLTETGSLAQYLSVRGAALPVTYADAVRLEGEGNHTNAVMAAGYVSNSLHAPRLPANTVLRPVGGPAQFFFDGSVRHPIQDPATSDCLVYAFPQPGVAVVPADWAAGIPVGGPASC